MSDDDNVIDLTPRLLAKKAGECQHLHCLIDPTAAEIVCSGCGAEIDPWWLLRDLAARGEEESQRVSALDAEIARTQKLGNLAIERMNERIHRLNDEINALLNKKNQLYNERIGGELLGLQVKRRARRRGPVTP